MASVVFISHKAGDRGIALVLKQIIQNTAPVDVFISEETPKGSNWRERIVSKLRDTLWFILIYTDPNNDWGWCLYETGFFEAIRSSRETNTTAGPICLHHPDNEPPNPIADLQSVPATSEDVNQWLEEFFAVVNPNIARNSDHIERIGAEICAAMNARKVNRYRSTSMKLILPFGGKTPTPLVLDSAVLTLDKSLASMMFGRNSSKITWQELLRDAEDDFDHRWMAELTVSINDALQEKVFHPMQAIIFAKSGEGRFRPVLHQVDLLPSGNIECEILLVPEVGGHFKNLTRSYAALLTTVRMALRIRYELVNPFLGRLRLLASTKGASFVVDGIRAVFLDIITEAESRGVATVDDLIDAFGNGEDRSVVMSMLELWPEVEKKLWRAVGVAGRGEAWEGCGDTDFSEAEMRLAEETLSELERMNATFLRVAFRRLADQAQEQFRSTWSPPSAEYPEDAAGLKYGEDREKVSRGGVPKGLGRSTPRPIAHRPAH